MSRRSCRKGLGIEKSRQILYTDLSQKRSTDLNGKKKEFVRTVKFTLFSASAGAIQFLSFTLFNELLCMRYFWAYLISLTLSVLWNFTLNRKITFKSANNVPVAMLKVAVYYLIFTPLSSWWGTFFTEKAHVNEYIVVIATMLINFVTEYLYQRLFVFGKSIDTAKKKRPAK